jgi:hypothetical protein
MNRLSTLHISLVFSTLLLIPIAQAATMNKVDYRATKARIGADYKADKAACALLKANAKDICVEEAKAKTGDGNKVKVAKADAAYAVAKEKCDDPTGNAKDVCVKEAKAVEVKALADAKLAKEVGAAKLDAAQDKRDADYKVAAEKCDALAGDAKTSCIAAAKTKFGKN